MKKILTALTCFLLCLNAFSQNGGQNTVNNVLRITYVGWSNGNHIVTLENRVNCSMVVTYNFDGVTQDVTIPALSTTTLTKAAPQSSILNAKAKRRSGANCISSPDNGWVEISTVGVALPIKFKSIYAKRIDKTTVEVIFEAEEDYDLSYYVIKLSYDNVNFKNVAVLFPDGIVSSKRYSVKIKL